MKPHSALSSIPLWLLAIYSFVALSSLLLASLMLSSCSQKVQIKEAPIEVCSGLNLLQGKSSLDASEPYTLYFTELLERYTKARRFYMEGEWAQQRGECEIAAKRGEDVYNLTKDIPQEYQNLSEKLDLDKTLDKANVEIQTAEKQIEPSIFPRAFKRVQTAKEFFVKARTSENKEKALSFAKEASRQVINAFYLRSLALSDEIDKEMAKAKVVLDSAEKLYAKAKEKGIDKTNPSAISEAEMYIKIARFDVEEKDPPEVAEFALKAINILEPLVKGKTLYVTPIPH